MRMLISLLLLSGYTYAQVEPGAGKWKTWIVQDAATYRIPPPPGSEDSEAELADIKVAASDSQAVLRQVMYWNAGAPGYRWNNLVRSLTPPGIPPFRELALLNVAIYDATIVAWDSKYHYNRPRPGAAVLKYIPVPQSPSYPCERAVAAGAAAAVLSYLFPGKADSITALALSACASRVASGIQYPSDVKAGFELGKQIGELAVARARTDGSSIQWNGERPRGRGLWTGNQPVGATYSKRKLYVLDSAAQFRPASPPDFTKDMEELRSFKQSQPSTARAFYYATQDEWSDMVRQKIFEYNLDDNAPRAARVYAIKSVAFHDALIACWEAKYHYWGIRPDQLDTTYSHSLITPPFPGYPSGHATTSSASATVMAYLFPAEADEFRRLARECAESRFEGGIHFRTDNEVGLKMGEKIGEAVIARIKNDGADK